MNIGQNITCSFHFCVCVWHHAAIKLNNIVLLIQIQFFRKQKRKILNGWSILFFCSAKVKKKYKIHVNKL